MDNIKLDCYIGETESKGYILGDLIIPSQNDDILKLITTDCKIIIEETSLDKDSIYIQGNAIFTVYYIDVNNKVNCFSSSAYFTHSLEASGINEDMNYSVCAKIQDITASITEPRKIEAKASVCFSAQITQKQIIPNLNFDGFEIQNNDILINDCQPMATSHININEDVRLQQGMPEAEKLLNTYAYGKISNVRTEGQRVIVTGEVILRTTYVSNERIWQNNDNIPFEEIVDLNICADGFEIVPNIVIKNVVSTLNDPCIITYDISATISLQPVSCPTVSIIDDVYSTSINVNASKSNIKYKTLVLNDNCKLSKKYTMSIENNKMQKPLCIFATPIVSNSFAIDGGFCFDGKIICDILYEDNDEQMDVIRIIIPLDETVTLDKINEGMHISCLAANIEQSSVILSGNDIEIKCLIDISINACQLHEKEIVFDIEPLEELSDERASIMIYFKDKDESLFSIAKKFHIPQNTIKEDNEKLILLNALKN